MVETDEAAGSPPPPMPRSPGRGGTSPLTLDWDLQTAAEEALAAFLDSHPQSTGGALVAPGRERLQGCWPW